MQVDCQWFAGGVLQGVHWYFRRSHQAVAMSPRPRTDPQFEYSIAFLGHFPPT
jgi:hypothetical protein